MKLKFRAREGQLCPVPGFNPGPGQAAAFIGRTFVAPKDGEPGKFPAVDTIAEYEAESSAGVRLIDMMRKSAHDPCLWAVDQFTADACGVSLVRTEFADGAHIAASESPKKTIVAAPKGSDS